MRYFTHNGSKYKVDALGYLLDPEEWDENFAEGMAPKVRIEGGLTKAHWKVIYFIRNTFDWFMSLASRMRSVWVI